MFSAATPDFMSHFPYPEARDIQRQLLETLSREWGRYDIFCISAPTAFGKTALSRTLMNALGSVSVVTPTNLLVDQYRAEFPDTPTLSRLDSYWCEEWDRPCPVTRAKLLQFCKGCDCGKAMAKAKYGGSAGVYNYHIYLAQKIYRDTLVVDEAHNLLPFIRDRLAQKIWQHDYGYPDGMYTAYQIGEWIKTLTPAKRRHKKIQLLWESVNHDIPEYMPQRTTDQFNGKGTQRGKPEERDCIKLLPVDITGAPPLFWPKEVRKVILLSATINKKDIEALGIAGNGGTGRARVLYINAESPIAASRRPIVVDPLVSVNKYNLETSVATLAQYIDGVLAPQHTGEKGVIHVTYQMARLLASHLVGPRYLFHNSENKKRQYEFFRASPPDEGRILVACGMSEGIDLPEDLGRWQVVGKIPWLNLGSPAVRYMSEKDPDMYNWETARTLIQTCGRISRTVNDYGVTYIVDSTFDKLYFDNEHLFPEWWKDALLNRGDYEILRKGDTT